LHRLLPVGVAEGSTNCRWRWRWCRRDGHMRILGIGPVDPNLRTRDHRMPGRRPSVVRRGWRLLRWRRGRRGWLGR
jgi:hypothetical protein